MTALPPILLILDVSAIVTTRTREWQEFSRVGTCFLPQAVLEEMRFLFDRAPEPALEEVAREFHRFHSHGNWQATEVSTPHPLLKASSGESLSKKARQSFAVAKCAYGMSQDHIAKLVVLVTNDQPLIQRLQTLEVPNLCAVTAAMLLQWSRTGQRPVVVSQQLQRMRTRVPTASAISTTGIPPSPKTSPRSNMTRPSGPTRTTSIPLKPEPVSSSRPSVVVMLIVNLLVLAGLAIAGWFVWRTFFQDALQPQPTETLPQSQ